MMPIRPGKVRGVWKNWALQGEGGEEKFGCPFLYAELCLWGGMEGRSIISTRHFTIFPLEISSLSDKDILILPLDLTERESHESATKTVLQHFGRVSFIFFERAGRERSRARNTHILGAICIGMKSSIIGWFVFVLEYSYPFLKGSVCLRGSMKMQICVRSPFIYPRQWCWKHIMSWCFRNSNIQLFEVLKLAEFLHSESRVISVLDADKR